MSGFKVLCHFETGDLFRLYQRDSREEQSVGEQEVSVVDIYEFYGFIPQEETTAFIAVYRIQEPLKSIIKEWQGLHSTYQLEEFVPEMFDAIRREQPDVYFKKEMLYERPALPKL